MKNWFNFFKRTQNPKLTPREKDMRSRLLTLSTWIRRHSSEQDAIDVTYYADRALSDFPDPDAKEYGRCPRKDWYGRH